MNRLAKWIMRLYPASWRARYGDELDALVSDAGADTRVVADLLKAGIRVQFKTWSFPALALALGIAGAVLGTGIGLLLPAQYTSRARLRVTPARIGESDGSRSTPAPLGELVLQTEVQIRNRRSLSAIIQNPRLDLYADERKVAPLEDVIDEMKGQIEIRPDARDGAPGGNAVTLDISLTYPDRLKVQQAAQEIVSMFQSKLEENSARSYPNYNEVLVVDPASLPDSPVFPGRLAAMLPGFLLGVLVASIWRMIQPTGFIARRFALVAIEFGIAGLLIVVLADYFDLLPYQYRSTATFQFPSVASSDQTRPLLAGALNAESLSLVINSPNLRLYQNELRTRTLEDVIQSMKHHLSITPSHPGGLTWLCISFDYPDPHKAQQTVQTIMNALSDAYQRLHAVAALPLKSPPVVTDVLERPSLPGRPSQYGHAATGFFVGLIAAAAIVLVRRRWKPEAPASV